MACRCSSCIFSTLFLESHLTNVTTFSFLDRIAISVAPSKAVATFSGFSILQGCLSDKQRQFLIWRKYMVMESSWRDPFSSIS